MDQVCAAVVDSAGSEDDALVFFFLFFINRNTGFEGVQLLETCSPLEFAQRSTKFGNALVTCLAVTLSWHVSRKFVDKVER